MQRRVINQGVSVLARELGLSPSWVSYKLNRGETADQIRKQYQGKSQTLGAKNASSPKTVVGRRAANKAAKASADSALDSRVETPVAVPVANGHGHRHADTDTDERTSFTIADQVQAEIRKAMALASKNELDLAVKRGEYVPVVTVNEWFGNVIVKARDYFMRQPGELAERLAALDEVEIVKLLEEAMVEGLEMLATLDGA